VRASQEIPNPSHMAERKDTILYLDGVSVSFDGFKALNDLSFYVLKGELRAVIGPNGAGKTTMMDVVTGKTRPDEGQVLFDGLTDLTRCDEARIANMGIGRKFQKPTVFENMSVFDNLELALSGARDVFKSFLFKLTGKQQDRIDEVMEIIVLSKECFTEAGALSHGQKQWLEIGMLLMQEPDLLLVDEPAAGMTDAETEQTSLLLRKISGDRSIVVVEHDMEFVKSLNSRVTVLHEGSVLAEGSLEKIQNDEKVIEVYLGR
jgi:urea transport system ATP-binding protein